MGDNDGRIWPYGPLAALLSAPVVFIVLLLVAVALQRTVGFPGKIDNSVFWIILALSLIPLGLTVFDVLAPRARTIELMGFKLALSGELETRQASISVPTNIGVPAQALSDSNTSHILAALDDMTDTDVAVIDLGNGQAWWETRLLIVAAGAARSRRPLAIVFLATDGDVHQLFQGWAEPEALLLALLAFNPEYRRCYERAKAAAAQWSLVEPNTPTPPSAPAPSWMSEVAAKRSSIVQAPHSLGFLLERILGAELGTAFEQPPGPLGPGPTKVTIARLKKVFGPVLQTGRIEEGWSDQEKVEKFLKTSERYVPITDRGIFKRMMLRESGMAALILSLLPAGPGGKEGHSSKNSGLKGESSTDKSSGSRGPLTLSQGLIGLGLLILFNLVTETGHLIDFGETTQGTHRQEEPKPTAVSHDTDLDRIRRELIDEIRQSRAGSGQAPPPAGIAAAAVPPVTVNVICPDSERPSASAKPTTRSEPCIGGRPSEAKPSEPRLLARWVQLISPNAECGSITAKSEAGAAAPRLCVPKLVVRAVLEGGGTCGNVAFRPGTHIALTMRPRSNPDVTTFPVTLCEAEAEPGDKAVSFADGSRIAWDGLERLGRVAVLGDTGCDTTKDVRQDCDGASSWPFREVALAATGIPDGSAGPDLVIHVGDYRYREGGAGDGDNWDNWYQDFFKPAEPLLLVAPWVMLRGNHENCFGKHGAGWFFLLQPEAETVSRCARDANRDPDNQPPYALDLRTGDDGRALRLVVVDSANAKYRCDSWARDFAIRDEKRLRRLLKTSEAKAWLLTHYPVWDAAEDYLSDEAGYNNVVRCKSDFETRPTVYRYREVMSAVVEEAGGRLEAIISGDTHQFQVLRVHDAAAPNAAQLAATSAYPLQIIAGHAGTKLDPALGPRTPAKSLIRTCDQESERVAYFQRKLADSDPRRWIVGKAVCSYGYATADRTGDRWTLSLKSFGTATGALRTSCELGSADPSCYQVRDKGHCSSLGEDSDCLPLRAAPN